ncbi:hypothetical protein NDN08_004501 [Rhodosorus marinus]|uniref:RZ-type domain-containing protein n=1 Tax=Rhodosorus marinus TaxID=101924 RepID=A0AAV8ULN0_9RHOD|nr:hypothetical protein NDN08_004501 [Rhodosorus marinus]
MPLLDVNRRRKFLDVVDEHLSSRSVSDATRVIEQLATDVGQERLVEVFSHRVAGIVSDRKLEEELNMSVIRLLARPEVAQSVVASKIYTAFAQFAVKFFTQVFEEDVLSRLENHPEMFDVSSPLGNRTLTFGLTRFARRILLAYKAFYEVLYRVPDIVRQDVQASLNLVELMFKPHEEIVAWSQVDSLGLSNLTDPAVRQYLVSAASLLTKIQHIAEEIHAQALMGETVQRDSLKSGDRDCIRGLPTRQPDDETHKPRLLVCSIVRRDPKHMMNPEMGDARLGVAPVDDGSSADFLASLIKSAEKRRIFMVEVPGLLFEPYRCLLNYLQETVPGVMPFAEILAPSPKDQDPVGVFHPPARVCRVDAPEFTYCKNFRELADGCDLDDGQREALLNVLSHKVALVEGPPGTGKTKLGVDIVRVLLETKEAQPQLLQGPIFCICYTNHALDQFLNHLLENKVTGIVRIGARSKDERIGKLNLETLVATAEDRIFRGREFYHNRERLKQLETVNQSLHEKIIGRRSLDFEDVQELLPPGCLEEVEVLDHVEWKDHNEITGPRGQEELTLGSRGPSLTRLFHHWRRCEDITAMENTLVELENRLRRGSGVANGTWSGIENSFAILENETSESSSESESDMNDDLLAQIESLRGSIKRLKNRDSVRSAEEIISVGEKFKLFELCQAERATLYAFLVEQMRGRLIAELNMGLAEANECYNMQRNMNNEQRKYILQNSPIIAATTSGAAKHCQMILAARPFALICEEAAEVLEVHVLASLSASVQHMILIGDHLQLRPLVQTYDLTIEGGKGYRLNESLFERLVNQYPDHYPSSKLLVQRRMRKDVSDTIRETLYPELLDGENTLEFPDVRGMGKNVFFLHHTHAENQHDRMSASSDRSKTNLFEVDLVEALVLYLVKNGYNGQKDIAVLTPYLAQLFLIKKALQRRIVVTLAEKDMDLLARERLDEDPSQGAQGVSTYFTNESLSQSVRVSTVDNFQGEEANIIVLSLVRNSGSPDVVDRPIGFVRNSNRINVMLSRARYGMYIMGNAYQLEFQSNMWSRILATLKEKGLLGAAYPLTCHTHKDYHVLVKSAEEFYRISPDGGCPRPCGVRLPSCGHICPLTCHAYDAEHRLTKCNAICLRLRETCDHSCPARCGEVCPPCQVFVGSLTLKCGHELSRARCFQKLGVDSIQCVVPVGVTLPCGHEKTVECSILEDEHFCQKQCTHVLECGHTCEAVCGSCARAKEGLRQHPKCRRARDRPLNCGHLCNVECNVHVTKESDGQQRTLCPPCKALCVNACEHSSCNAACSVVCVSCAEPCAWKCPHKNRKCPLPCGAPCSMLPCDFRCPERLPCGHRCPGLCGEPCPESTFCHTCGNQSTKKLLVDYVLMSKYEDINPDKDPVVFLNCGHPMTMESIDNLMEIDKVYVRSRVSAEFVDLVPYNVSSILSEKRPVCPLCRTPIHGVRRYGRILNQHTLSAIMRNFKYEFLRVKESFDSAADHRARLLEKYREEFKSLAQRKSNETLREERNVSGGRTSIDRYHLNLCNSAVKKVNSVFPMRTIERFYKRSRHPPTERVYQASLVYMENDLLDSESCEAQVGLETPRPDYELCIWSAMQYAEFLHQQADALVLMTKLKPAGMDVNKLIEVAFIDLLHAYKWYMDKALVDATAAKYYRHAANTRLAVAGLNYAVMQLIQQHQEVVRKLVAVRHQNAIAPNTTRNSFREFILTLKDWLDYVGRKDKRVVAKDCQRVHDLLVTTNLDEAVSICPDGYKPILEKAVAEARKEYSRENTAEYKLALRLEIIEAMKASSIGLGVLHHCPRGHLYSIMNCGEANQAAHCVEYGLPIGGSNYALLPGNRRIT